LSIATKSCPADIVGEVHFDGEIVGSLGWSLRELFGPAVADPLVWGATTLLTPNPSLADFARGINQTAEDLMSEGALTEADVAEVRQAVADRGLDTCEKVLQLESEQPHTSTMFGLDLLAQALEIGTCANVKDFGLTLQTLFHYRTTPHDDTEGVRFAVDMAALGGGSLDWTIHVRKSEHVTFGSSGFLPEVNQSDYSAQFSGPTGELIIDAASNPPFDPSASYYAVIVHQNCPNALVSISAGVVEPDSGGGGAGGGSGGGGGGGGPSETDDPEFTAAGGGCSCRISDSRPTRVPALLALAGLFGTLYRRRRTRPDARALRRSS